VQEFQPKIVSTALGSPRRVLDTVHGYGGIVMADVINPALARKAADAGADVLVLVTQGAGATPATSTLALLAEVRKFWSGPLGLAGAITTGTDIRAAQLLGADFVLAGTRFIATPKAWPSRLPGSHRQQRPGRPGGHQGGVRRARQLAQAHLDKAGFTPEQLREEKKIDFSGDIVEPQGLEDGVVRRPRVGGIEAIASTEAVVRQLYREYAACLDDELADLTRLRSATRPLEANPLRESTS
jgi:nitronate monooxygenase